MRSNKRVIWLYLFIFMAFIPAKESSAAQVNQPSQNPKAAPALKPLIFLVPTATFISSLPIWVALASNYFAEEGLDVRIVSGAGGSLGIAMLLNGSGQIGGVGDTAIRAALQGAPVKVIGIPVRAANFYLYSRSEFADINQLKGNSIAVGSLNGTPHVLAMKILHNHYGWSNPSRDIRWVSVREQRVQAVQSGAVQAAMILSPENVQADRLGMHRHFTTMDYMPIPSGGITVSADYLRKNPDDVRSFLRGHVKGLERTHSDSQFAISVLQQRLKIDRATAKAIYESQLSTFTRDDTVPGDALKVAVDFNKEQMKTITRDIKPDDIFDFTIVGQVGGELQGSASKP
jgi:ABC-type nitrate/sulfonate/bicarbonate transport system substrate-binding protein